MGGEQDKRGPVVLNRRVRRCSEPASCFADRAEQIAPSRSPVVLNRSLSPVILNRRVRRCSEPVAFASGLADRFEPPKTRFELLI